VVKDHRDNVEWYAHVVGEACTVWGAEERQQTSFIWDGKLYSPHRQCPRIRLMWKPLPSYITDQSRFALIDVI
jgi:hypothetical protein